VLDASSSPWKSVADIVGPIGALWVTHSTLLATAKFVNDIRDTVTLGFKDSVRLTMLHRRAMVQDWFLTMIGTIGGSLIYSALLVAAAISLGLAHGEFVAMMMAGVALFPIMAAILFCICGRLDYHLMKKQLEVDHHGGWDDPDRFQGGKGPVAKASDAAHEG
jgi:hypothetical protein